jgi:riboflavin synthase alpha subunit
MNGTTGAGSVGRRSPRVARRLVLPERGRGATRRRIPQFTQAVVCLTVLAVCATLLCLTETAWAQALPLFSDGFETGIVGWTEAPTVDWFPEPGASDYCVRVRSAGSIERTISTVCYENITVSFFMGAKGLEAGETVRALWYDGSSWNVLKTIGNDDPEEDGKLHSFEYALPASAADNADFAIRFEINGSNNGDHGFVDDVVVSGDVIQYALSLTGSGNGSVLVNGTPQSLPWSGSFDCGSVVDLEAAPDSAWDFGGWTGDVSWSGTTVAITMDGGKSVTATFTAQPTLSLTKGGTGTGSVSVNGTPHALPWLGQFPAGSSVTLAAAAEAGSEFDGWTGDVTWPTSPLTVTMNGSKSITASFSEASYTLSLTKGGTGTGSVTVNGTPQTLPWSGQFPAGSSVTLAAAADAGSEFDGWSGDVSWSGATVSVTMNGNKTITASFGEPDSYRLTVSKAGNGSVAVDGSPVALPWSGDFAPGSEVTLEATADGGWQFDGWSGDASAATNVVAVTMDGAKSVTACFSELSYTLSLTASGSGRVTVNGVEWTLPQAQEFGAGSSVTLAAAAAYGYRFEGWSGSVSGTESSIAVTMDGDLEIAATFIIPSAYRLSVRKSGGLASITVNGIEAEPLPWEGEFAPGTDVTLRAVVDPGEDFLGWEVSLPDELGPSAVASNPFTITMDWDKVVVANFACFQVFTDVPCGYWALNEINAVYAADIAGGYPDGFYQPRWTVDRASMAVFIVRALVGGSEAIPTGPAVATFPDVPTDHWAFAAVEGAVQVGVVEGYGDGEYHPDWACTRGQMAVFIAQATGYFGDTRSYRDSAGDSLVSEDVFPDVAAGYWCDAQVKCCVDNGVVSGYTDGYYRPTWTVSRDQMAVFIARAFELPM